MNAPAPITRYATFAPVVGKLPLAGVDVALGSAEVDVPPVPLFLEPGAVVVGAVVVGAVVVGAVVAGAVVVGALDPGAVVALDPPSEWGMNVLELGTTYVHPLKSTSVTRYW